MTPLRAPATVLLLMATIGSGWAGGQKSDTGFKASLRSSCTDKPFLSVSAVAPRHDSFVDVDVRLVDPQQRSAGYGKHDRPIPKSAYGKVIEVPDHPEMSKAVAAEVCDPMQGNYEITVWEHTKAKYRIHVWSSDAKGSYYADLLYPVPEEGRTCRYTFAWHPAEDDAIRWIDGEGHMLPIPQKPRCVPIQQASLIDGSALTLVTEKTQLERH